MPSLHVRIFYGLLAVNVAVGWRIGDRPARWLAFIMAAATMCSVGVRRTWAERFTSVEFGLLAVDLLTVGSFIAIAIWKPRWWTIGIAAVQLVATMGHLAKWLNPGLYRNGYAVMVASSSYPVVLLLLAGMLHHWWQTRSAANARSIGS